MFQLQRSWTGSFIACLLGSALIASSFNLFLIPHQLLSGGISGVSMLVGYFTDWNISLLFLIFNAPLLIWGLLTLGRKFIILSVVSVVLTTWFMQLIPSMTVSKDLIMSSVAGGVLVGIGTGISMRVGGSTGGFDIIASILTRKRDFSLGTFLFGLNGIVIVALGFFKNNWDLALYSMLSMFITGKIIDTIHIRHLKVTVFIITKKKDLLLKKMQKLKRGVTVIDTEGAYTKEPQHMLMTVTTRYELNELQNLVRQWDPQAFVNITETVGVMGLFRRSDRSEPGN
ncbi:YitT family protein [Paenibacillus ehimensis]|uniref:YitT family protein n=1 Tax=Paenibacillus ehimensis TaxID=79264 RepID=A0ABT8VBP9_9BACL|nr:YitT family protein [Paenibacillus ehimensis]MDO3678385.1 YitT family protein [Paenibacillus ehimensis]MEC0211643.1 YitT family protein [Paenibacillus ehimensis]